MLKQLSHDIPKFKVTLKSFLFCTMATFADDTAVMALGKIIESSSRKL
jgi:hypothetical protein